MFLWVTVSWGNKGRKHGRQTQFPNPFVHPASLNLSYLSTLAGSFCHIADTSSALSPHCQGANKPWKLSIWRASDQTLARTWKLSYVCVWSSSGAEHHAWWQSYDSVRRTWWWAKRLYTLRFSVTCSSTQMWAMLWLQPAQCWSRPVNLIPISGSLIMCLLVLAFVRKWNKETGKTIGESQKREGGRKRVGLFREVIWQQKA